MTDLFDFKPKEHHFAVMGNPVKHSKSPRIHALFAQQFDLTLHYQRIQVDPGGFAQAVSHFAAHGGSGLNITLPFKVEAWRLCRHGEYQLSARAQLAEAVNTLRFVSQNSVEDAAILGDNTDGIGLIRDLQNNLQFQLKDKRILVLGAGGAVRGIVGMLAQCQPQRLIIANRTAHKAQQIAEKLAAEHTNHTHTNPLKRNIFGCGYDRLDEYIDAQHSENFAFDLIINGTSASLTGELPALSTRCINSTSVAYDMLYADSPTVFMRWALAHGVDKVSDGLGMLVEQAAESFYVWHAKRPQTAPVLCALRNNDQ